MLIMDLWTSMTDEGPKAGEEYMSPAYRKIIKFFQEHGVKIISIDSDGKVEPLIPIWLKHGINRILSCEAVTVMNVVMLGKKYPSLIMSTETDKRELAKDKKPIEQEAMSKVPPLIKRKGYFPGVGHVVPPDVPLEN
ncbi:MAG: hypothetical protein QXI36_06025 [Candidatus Bathyarchaeia archaeon]